MLTDKYDMILYTMIKGGMIIWVASMLIRFLSESIADTFKIIIKAFGMPSLASIPEDK